MLQESVEKEKKIGRMQRENFRKAFQAGAKIAFGTDSGVYPHGDNAKQFAKMVEWGMKPIDAITGRNISAADLIGLSKSRLPRVRLLRRHHRRGWQPLKLFPSWKK